MGYVSIQAEGPLCEPFLNECARIGIRLRELGRTRSGVLVARCSVPDFFRLREAVRESGCLIRIYKKTGLPFILHRYRARPGILAGIVIFMLFTWGIGSFVWNIDVEGNSSVSAEVILDELQALGFEPGVLKSSLDLYDLRAALVLRMPELIWVSVNIRGTHATVEVAERSPPPLIVELDKPCNIVAAKSGYIVSAEVYEGKQIAVKGDAVIQGELLVSGIIDSGMVGYRLVHAHAKIMAEVPHTITVRQALKVVNRVETGRSVTRPRLRMGKYGVNLYHGSGIPYENYDIIRKTRKFSLWDFTLPVDLAVTEYREIELVTTLLTEEAALELATMELEAKLGLLGGEILTRESSYESVGGEILLTAVVTCLEDIAVKRALGGDGEDYGPLLPGISGW